MNTTDNTNTDNAATNDPKTETKTNTKPDAESIANAVVEMASAWADVGIAHARTALFSTSHAMNRTAKALDVVREHLRSYTQSESR